MAQPPETWELGWCGHTAAWLRRGCLPVISQPWRPRWGTPRVTPPGKRVMPSQLAVLCVDAALVGNEHPRIPSLSHPTVGATVATRFPRESLSFFIEFLFPSQRKSAKEFFKRLFHSLGPPTHCDPKSETLFKRFTKSCFLPAATQKVCSEVPVTTAVPSV